MTSNVRYSVKAELGIWEMLRESIASPSANSMNIIRTELHTVSCCLVVERELHAVSLFSFIQEIKFPVVYSLSM